MPHSIRNKADILIAKDNDEFCASCGGEGKLLCCDGCTNSFHHACLEPPLDPEEEVIGEWYCPQCQAKRVKDTEQSKSMLAKALRALDHTIPRAFALPHVIRDYFEGVRTGDEGEYTEFGQPRTTTAPKMNRAGFIEEPNYKEPRDSKGNLNLCKGCGLGTNGKDLIPCDFCDAKWHLDCVDPPLAVPPRRRAGDKPTSSWRCPLHIDQDLAGLGRQAEAAPGDLGGRPRLRKPKNARPIDVDFPRGFRNNGVIDVELSDDGPSIREIDMQGTIYRLPEQAIRLDFIDRVKRSWYEDQTFPDTVNGHRPQRFVNRDYRPRDPAVLHAPKQIVITMREPEFYKGSQALSIVESARANAALRRKTLPEQQAILNLAKMARTEKGEIYGDALADLTNAVVSEAPEAAEQLVNHNERTQLQHLQGLIDRRIRILDGRDGVVAHATSNRPKGDNRYFSPGTNFAAPRDGGQINYGPPRNSRDIQPAPAATFTPVQYYHPNDPNFVLQGQPGTYPPPPYAGPPPPQPWQSAYAPYPSGPTFGQWQAQINPPSVSPNKPPYPSQNQSAYGHNQGSPLTGVLLPATAGPSASTPGQTLLQNMPPFYGPSPPPHNPPSIHGPTSPAPSASGKPNSGRSRRGSVLNANTTPASVDAPPPPSGDDPVLDPALFNELAGLPNANAMRTDLTNDADQSTSALSNDAAKDDPNIAVKSEEEVLDDAWIYGPSPVDLLKSMYDDADTKQTKNSSTEQVAGASSTAEGGAKDPANAVNDDARWDTSSARSGLFDNTDANKEHAVASATNTQQESEPDPARNGTSPHRDEDVEMADDLVEDEHDDHLPALAASAPAPALAPARAPAASPKDNGVSNAAESEHEGGQGAPAKPAAEAESGDGPGAGAGQQPEDEDSYYDPDSSAPAYLLGRDGSVIE